ncbi:MAG: TonB-dependent receptor [Gammaproteobacteria bacterium]|nr:TonB-dependent receptor [Gammaproteobacteria bacterium]
MSKPALSLLTRRLASIGIPMTLCLSLASPIAFSAEKDEDAAKLDKVQVTGSHIKRTDMEGPSPVLVIDKEDIERSGVSTVSELLQNLTSNGGGAYDEKFSNSFAPGSSAISMRGLGQDATLVLINGRRVANYGFSQNITDSFVDLNSIPLGAIERIEILKDGASAVYGSEALAGVINFILKDNYQGASGDVRVGATAGGGGDEQAFNFIGGTSNGKTSLNFALNYFDREIVMLTDRDFSSSADQTANGGYDFRSSAYPISNVRSATTGAWIDINGFFDYNPFMSLIPSTTRAGSLVNFNHQLGGGIDMFASVSFNQNKTYSEMAPTPLFGDVEGVVVPTAQPFNTYGEDVFVRWRMLEMGPRTSSIETAATRGLVGIKGDFAGWDWELATTRSRSRTVDTGSNYVNRLALIGAINDGTINPFGTTTNDQAVLDSIRASTSRIAISNLEAWDFKAAGEVMQLPAGPLSMAVGLESREERVSDNPDSLSAQGQIIGSGGTSSNGSRELTSFHVEASAPLMSGLELQVAGRRDDYSDFGATTNPKIALRYQPIDMVVLRGSYGTGFRAPSLAELYLGESESYPFLIDTSRCQYTGASADCGGSQYRTIFAGNPDLDPETSESTYFGLVLEPLKGFSIGYDLWSYVHDDVIDANTQYILDNESSFPGRVNRGPSTGVDPVTGNPIPGQILFINDGFTNIAGQKTNGYDLSLNYGLKLGGGKLGFSYVSTVVQSFKRRPIPTEPYEELIGEYNRPKERNQFGIAWDAASYTVNLTRNFIDSYNAGYPDATTGEETTVDEFVTWDLNVAYNSGYGKFSVGANNLTDEDPPFSNAEAEGYDFSVHDPRGRFSYIRYALDF